MSRAITFLNGMGDITITWDESEDEKIKQMIESKMKEGYTFFIVEDGFLSRLTGRKKKISSLDELGNRRKVLMDDGDLEDLFSKGKVGVYNNATDNDSEVVTKGKLVDVSDWFRRQRQRNKNARQTKRAGTREGKKSAKNEQENQRSQRLVGVRRAVGG